MDTDSFVINIKTEDVYEDIADDVEKRNKEVCSKKKIKFNDYKNCLLNNEIIPKSQQNFKSEAYNVHTEEINKIAFSCNDDKRLQTFDRVTSCPYGSSLGKVCKKEILR